MNYIVLNDQITHITHNDSDALGSALVVDLYRANSLTHGATKGYLPVHTFNSVNGAKENLLFIIDMMNSVYTSNETGWEFDELDLDRFQKLLSGFRYDPLGTIAVPGEIIITDLSIDSDILDKLEDISKKFNIKFLYVDHHKSSVENNQRYSWCHVTTTDENGTLRSACKYLLDIYKEKYENFTNVISNHSFFERYIDDISRYDTWLWKTTPKDIPTENETTVIINAVGGIENAYKIINRIVLIDRIDMLSLSSLPEVQAVISASEMKKQSYIKKYTNSTVYSMGYNLEFNTPEYATAYFALVILPEEFGNDIMENIYTNSERHIDVVVGIYPSSKTLSFRKGPHSKIDLSVLAKRYGGGGHDSAAGAKLNTDQFIEILTKYYIILDEKNN